eukprot:TRINITY_DN36216_c0_g1_i1.p1 TRINITY_DN36216_c0_g1~~TRINITY_DN36216_c0_g1_i1.p1  ORF type:complete len:725 (+),score=122.57 TRINITY_DN36216_c0_g1_i1:163-2337(+)
MKLTDSVLVHLAQLLVAASLSSAVRLANDDRVDDQAGVDTFLRSRAQQLLTLLQEAAPFDNHTEHLKANIEQFRGVLPGDLSDDALVPALLQNVQTAVSKVDSHNFYTTALHVVPDAEDRKGRSVAVLAAFQYRANVGRLQGTMADAANVWKVLVEKRGFSPQDILLCTDYEGEFQDKPLQDSFAGSEIKNLPWKFWTPALLLQELRSRTRALKDGDFFVFHYSGHGGQVPDETGKELDGRREVLYLPGGNLRDYDIYPFLCELEHGVQATLIADACHSQGWSNLPYNYNPGYARKVGGQIRFFPKRQWCCDWVESQPHLPKATIRYFSGSQNKQTSADIGHAGGAFTLHLFEVWMGYAGVAQHERVQGDKGSVFNLFKQMLLRFQEGKAISKMSWSFEQVPNFNSWPTVEDDSHLELWEGSLQHLTAVGGHRPNSNTRMRVPPRCDTQIGLDVLPFFDRLDYEDKDGAQTGLQTDNSLRFAQLGPQQLLGWIVHARDAVWDSKHVVGVLPGPVDRSFHDHSKDSQPRSQWAQQAAEYLASRKEVVPPELEAQFTRLTLRFRDAAPDTLLVPLMQFRNVKHAIVSLRYQGTKDYLADLYRDENGTERRDEQNPDKDPEGGMMLNARGSHGEQKVELVDDKGEAIVSSPPDDGIIPFARRTWLNVSRWLFTDTLRRRWRVYDAVNQAQKKATGKTLPENIVKRVREKAMNATRAAKKEKEDRTPP